MRLFCILLTLLWLLVLPSMLCANEAQTAKEGFKDIHRGLKKITNSVDKKATKGVKAIDKKAKTLWKKAAKDIKKTTGN
ncbi:MAG: hypothetical protein KKC46_21570 [Proteobacteria bacterium]|nr:hypothetical protein [Pseudomonadota bacterium]